MVRGALGGDNNYIEMVKMESIRKLSNFNFQIRETPGKSGRVGICGKLETSLLQSAILEAKKWKF